jgi:hypothetical protein
MDSTRIGAHVLNQMIERFYSSDFFLVLVASFSDCLKTRVFVWSCVGCSVEVKEDNYSYYSWSATFSGAPVPHAKDSTCP